MPSLTLIIGNKNYSSWSLRPWLAMTWAKIPFDEIRIPLYAPDTKAQLSQHSPSGRVPVLRHGDMVIWESLAICEYIADLFPEVKLWPENITDRAIARSVSCEMHAGFSALRQSMAMDIRSRHFEREHSPQVHADVERVCQIWRDCRTDHQHAGEFLFGAFSIADAMFAPVVTRFVTYGVALDPVCRAYSEAILALPAMQAWQEAAIAEVEVIEHF